MKPSHCLRGHEMTDENTSIRSGLRIRWACKTCHREAAKAERLRRKNGEALKRFPTLARLMEKVKKTDSCWLWMAASVPRGYGVIFHEGKQQYAHRVSYLLHGGTIESGQYVMHSCDNPKCVNPAHLRAGTPLENVRDMMSKGRHRMAPPSGDRNPARLYPEIRRGARNGMAKLTKDQVDLIRMRYALGETQTSIGVDFGIRQCHVSSIVRRKAWA